MKYETKSRLIRWCVCVLCVWEGGKAGGVHVCVCVHVCVGVHVCGVCMCVCRPIRWLANVGVLILWFELRLCMHVKLGLFVAMLPQEVLCSEIGLPP